MKKPGENVCVRTTVVRTVRVVTRPHLEEENLDQNTLELLLEDHESDT